MAQITPYPIIKKFDFPQLDAITLPTGRTYKVPSGVHAPSVTTILSKTLPHDGLDQWRERVGNEEADRILHEAGRIGSSMHDMLETYVGNYLRGNDVQPFTDEEKISHIMAGYIRRYGLVDLEEVWGIEEAIHCYDLYAGRTDLIGVYNGIPSIIDYKSSRMLKRLEWIDGYYHQIAAYLLAVEEMFNTNEIRQGVILIANRPNEMDKQFGKIKKVQRFIMDFNQLEEYKDKWLNLVDQYYNSQLQ